LKGRDVSVVIEAIDQVTLPQGQGRKLVATFRGKAKAWIVNKTNANTIAKVLGTDETDDWVGQEIVLYPTETEFQGDMVDAIRVRRKKASAAPQAPAAPRETEPVDLPDDEEIPF
jgi:hypothetical protein